MTFENERTREARLEWCKENGVVFYTVLLRIETQKGKP